MKVVSGAVVVVAVLAATAIAAVVLRQLTTRTRSLRNQVLATTLAALVLGAITAVALARVMVLDQRELVTVVGVLVATAVVATALVIVATTPLARDVRRLELTVRAIEAGDRTVRTEVRRADELGHVAAALDQLTARLDHLEWERAGYEAERATMLSTIGHDLRTPLAALRAALEALVDGIAPEPARYLRSMQHDVEALTALVDDFFLLSRIESGRLDLHRSSIDLTEVVDEAVEALTPIGAARGIDIVMEADQRVRVEGSPVALGRVVRNLLDNAIRHAPDSSTVRVAVRADGRATVSVVDEGAGFPSEFQDHAFDRFSRADSSRARHTGGAGLGLAIAKGLVEAHGGRIWIDAAPGGRVTFEL